MVATRFLRQLVIRQNIGPDLVGNAAQDLDKTAGVGSKRADKNFDKRDKVVANTQKAVEVEKL